MRLGRMSKSAFIVVAVAATACAFVLPRSLLERVGRAVTAESGMANASSSPMATAAEGTPVYSGSADWPADARVRLSAWKPEYSDDLSARTVAVVASGNLLYAMGEVGSIYVSSDDAATWTQVASVAQQVHQPMRMGDFEVMPAQGDRPVTFFAQDGSSWPKFYRVRNGETEVLTVVATRYPPDGSVRQIAIAGQSVHVSTDVGMYRSDDGGDTWTLSMQTSYACALVSAGSTVYAKCVDGLYRSVAGGAFQLMSNRPELRWAQVTPSPSSPDVIYAASSETIMRSVDGGSSWTTTVDFATETDPMNLALFSEFEDVCAGSGGGGSSYGAAFAVDPLNPSVVWIGGRQLFRSDDGAEHFGRASVRGLAGADPGVLPVEISSLAFRGNSLHMATPDGVYGTTNRHAPVQAGGASACTAPGQPPQTAWRHEAQGANGQKFYEVAVSGDGSVLATTDLEGLLYTDMDDLQHWLPMPIYLGAPGIYIDPAGGIDRFYTRSCQGGQLCRWDLDLTQGKWSPTPLMNVPFTNVGFVAMDPAGQGRAFALVGSAVHRSTDGFATSTIAGAVSACGTTLGAVSPVDSNIIIAPTGCGEVVRGSNALQAGDAPWAVQKLRNEYWTVNDVTFASAQRAYFVVAGSTSKVYASADAGLSWHAADVPGAGDGLPDGVIRAVVADPEASDVVYVGGDAGIFVSWNIDAAGDGSRAWFKVPAPFTGAPIQKLAVRVMPDGSRRLFAFTYGAGLWSATIEATRFGDVGFNDWSYDYVKRLAAAGITNGCSTFPLSYCPQQPVLREQMAAFLLRAVHGGSYQPPPAVGYFADVPTGYWAASWIERLRYEGITNGCSADPALYCPGDVVPREQIAVFLLRAKHGAGYQPPAATGMFADVPADSWAAGWIEQLAREGIANGCSVEPAMYCPADPVTREQMAAFLVRTFNL